MDLCRTDRWRAAVLRGIQGQALPLRGEDERHRHSRRQDGHVTRPASCVIVVEFRRAFIIVKEWLLKYFCIVFISKNTTLLL